MRSTRLVVSLVILMALAGYYYCFELYRPGSDNAAGEQDRAIFPLDAAEVRQISIRGDTAIELSKKDAVWHITGPVETLADPREIAGLLHAMTALRSQRSLGEAGSSGGLGLDPPELTLVLTTQDTEFTLHVGSGTPTGMCCYACSSDRDDVFLIQAYEKSRLNRDVFTLRDKHLFSPAGVHAKRVFITRHALMLEFLKDSDGTWHLPGDGTRQVKTARMNGLLGALCRLEVLSYCGEEGEQGDPDITIELGAHDSAERLEVWTTPHSGGGIRALSCLQDGMVTVSESLLAVIPHDQDDMTDRSLVDIDAGSVRKITVADPAPHDLTRRAGDWYRDGLRVHDTGVLASLDAMEYENEYLQIPEEVNLLGSIPRSSAKIHLIGSGLNSRVQGLPWGSSH